MPETIACVDGRDLSLTQGSGIATYGRNLLTTLSRMGVGTQVLYGPPTPVRSDPLLDEIMLANPDARAGNPTAWKRLVRTTRARWGLPAVPVQPGQVIWPRDGAAPPATDSYWASQDVFRTAHRSFVKTGRLTQIHFKCDRDVPAPDVCHWTAIMPLRGKDALNLYTMHDLIPLRLPHLSLSNKEHYLAICRAIADGADHIIVGSESAKADIVDMIGVSPDRITNTYHAVQLPSGHMERSDDEIAVEIEGAFGLPWKGYFLHYGTIEPRKNLGRTVEAYLASGVTTPLVIAGGDGWLFEPETAVLDQVRAGQGAAAGRIIKLKYLPAGLLASLVRGARALLFPSLYEGFGLPVLEAMSMGTAVLTSTSGSLPEVAGGAAVLVDPYDVNSIRKGILALDGDEGLRDAMVERGTVQARLFSPQAYEARLTDLYTRLGLRLAPGDTT
ncbi:glycosyltransferase family 4 protein [Brevundimonas subvibrioides]|uniref:glycosyltransferase family 4 protein n=1 Tax=Brevundimonas subvibrioides TaxID=74313 RepID=UPI0022B51EB0|nr:glycosyltransferase family 1 protein [Brevundimonas subvibrioides]